MSMPKFPDNDSLSREDVINQIISSIAMEELSLSHILNAEGEKLQYALGTLEGVPGPEERLTIEELLKVNDSVTKTLDSTVQNQFFLRDKLKTALSAGATGAFDKTQPLFTVKGTAGSAPMRVEDTLTFRSTDGSVSIAVSQGSTIVDLSAEGATGPTGAPVPVTLGDNLIFNTNTPTALELSVAPDSATVTIDNLLETQVVQNATDITNLNTKFNVFANYSATETPTGGYFNGKPIFRQVFELYISGARNTQQEDSLINIAGYVDSIVDAGGSYSTGNGAEKFQVGGTWTTTTASNSMYGFAMVTTTNTLTFRSRSSETRNNALAQVWVDFTKV